MSHYLSFKLYFLLSFLFNMSMCQYESESIQLPSLKSDEFLEENIHSQLVNFHMSRHLKFQSYLVRMSCFSMRTICNLQI